MAKIFMIQRSQEEVTNFKKGQATIIATLFFLFISLIVISGSSSLVLKESKIIKNLIFSKESYFLAESGIEDVSYRIMNLKSVDSTEILKIDDFYATTTVVTLDTDQKEITAQGSVFNSIRKIKAKMTTDTSLSFHYGVQMGEGGLIMENNSLVSGNVYSNGPINGSGSNLIKGDVVSAGPNGLINSIHSTSSAYSHNITNSTIDRDAFYVNISNTNVSGTLHPNSPDQATSTLPISDEIIQDWEEAAAVSVIDSPCPYEINDDITLGPVKITCDVEIKGNPTIVLLGPIWITGNLTAENTAIIKIDSSLGGKSVAIIVDKPADRSTSSKILFKNSVSFQGSGSSGSYILVISQNNSAQGGGDVKAIDVMNTVSGAILLYSGHGEIVLRNSLGSLGLKEVTAYKIRLQNSANVIYEKGLANMLFQSGPAGGYSFGNWSEVP